MEICQMFNLKQRTERVRRNIVWGAVSYEVPQDQVAVLYGAFEKLYSAEQGELRIDTEVKC